jgi:hypothetical protein
MNLKRKSPLFIEFPFTWLNNLKFVERIISKIFHLKYSFCCLLDSAARGQLLAPLPQLRARPGEPNYRPFLTNLLPN